MTSNVKCRMAGSQQISEQAVLDCQPPSTTLNMYPLRSTSQRDEFQGTWCVHVKVFDASCQSSRD